MQVSYRGVDETLASSRQKVVVVYGSDKLVSPWQEAERPVNTANSREERDVGFGILLYCDPKIAPSNLFTCVLILL